MPQKSRIDRNINLDAATDEELARIKAMTDDELLRSAQTLDLGSIVEATRRLRVALHNEERAIKRLTGVSVALAVILVVLTLVLIALGVETLRRMGPAG